MILLIDSLVKRKMFAVAPALLLLGAAVWFYWGTLTSLFAPKKISKELEVNRIVNLLTGGIERNGRQEHLLSLYLASYEPVTKRMSIIYFPNNTLGMSLGDDREYKTIEKIYADGGVYAIKASLDHFLNIEIPFYFFFERQAFKETIDILGGVDMKIVRPIKFRDLKKEQIYFVKKGHQLLLGEKLYEYLSFNQDSLGDIGRNYRQSRFIKALVEKFQLTKEIIMHRSIARYIYQKISLTNLREEDLRRLFTILISVKPYDIIFDKVPGKRVKKKEGEYYQANAVKALDRLPQSYEDILLANQRNRNITVQILNGTRIKGLAAKLRETLQPFFDMDVVEIGNANNQDREITYIYDRKNNFRSAQRIKELIGLGKIEQKKDKDSFLDVTIVIGKDLVNKMQEEE